LRWRIAALLGDPSVSLVIIYSIGLLNRDLVPPVVTEINQV